MRNSTLLFLVKKSGDQITDICLAMKKRGFGAGRWNGVGGKVEGAETIEDAVRREAREEIGVAAGNLLKIAELSFTFPHNSAWDQKVHVYFSDEWKNDPAESEEMSPKWHAVSEIPYDAMWPADIFWLPKVIEGNLVRGAFTFGEGDVVRDQEVEVINFF